RSKRLRPRLRRRRRRAAGCRRQGWSRRPRHELDRCGGARRLPGSAPRAWRQVGSSACASAQRTIAVSEFFRLLQQPRPKVAVFEVRWRDTALDVCLFGVRWRDTALDVCLFGVRWRDTALDVWLFGVRWRATALDV